MQQSVAPRTNQATWGRVSATEYESQDDNQKGKFGVSILKISPAK